LLPATWTRANLVQSLTRESVGPSRSVDLR
jgi:hypothetical protein